MNKEISDIKFISPIQGWAVLFQYFRYKRLFENGLLTDPMAQQIYAELEGWA